MTVNYSLDASSSTFLGTQRLLFRWKGSLWKSTSAELALWLIAYYALSLSYRLAMNPHQQKIFEDLAIFFNTYSEFIPLTFMLGFYVSTVYNRWREIFDHVGWIDTPALALASFIRGADERSRMIRRNCVRYMVLLQAMILRDVSTPVKKRFPTMQHVVTAGLLTEKEKTLLDSVTTQYSRYWIPMQWTFSLLRMARDEKRIDSDHIYIELVEVVKHYRLTVTGLTLYDWVNVPLVYTQVVTLAVRSYFLIAVLGRQFLITDRNIPNARTMDIYVPVMTILQFLCYFGWLKVAEALLNPLGEDDDDFEVNYILDRNLQVGLLVVDDAYGLMPQLEKDIFWGDTTAEPFYTAESAQRTIHPNIGSCAEFEAKNDGMMIRQRRPTIAIANGELLTTDGGIEAVPVPKNDRDDLSYMRRGSALSDANFFKRLHGMASRKSSVSSVYSTGPFDNKSPSPSRQEKMMQSSPASGRCHIPIGPIPTKSLSSPNTTSTPRHSFRTRIAPTTGLSAISEEHHNERQKVDNTENGHGNGNGSDNGNGSRNGNGKQTLDVETFIRDANQRSRTSNGQMDDSSEKTEWRM